MLDSDDSQDQTQSFFQIVPGVMISHYQIIEKIGAGGMGEVFLADDTELKRQVALKFLPPHLCQDQDCRKRFKREAQAAANLKHPNIVTIYEVGEFEGRPFFAMDHCEGQSLRDLLAKKTHSIGQIVSYAIQICEGLQEAHSAGVVHRDIKPSNIVIDKNGRPKLVDFGLASIHGAEKLTKTGSTLGTVGYMSPEQIEVKDIDHRSDLFSFGVLLYEMIAGRAPFPGETEVAIVKSVIGDTPEPLARYKSDIPEELQRTVSKLLEKDPSLRYQSAAGVISDLKRLVRSPVSGEAISGSPRPRRFKLISVTTIALFAALIIISGYLILDQTRIPQKLGLAASGETRWTNSIAVLPFRDFSPGQDQEYFCDGMTDALIGRLSGVEDLKVISMTSVMRYKTPDRNLKKIGRDLRVNTVLEGSIQREDNRIRVRAQLINVPDDAHLWSETYDRELESVFDIQDDISRAIVDAMRIELFGKDEAVITRRYTENIEAYNFYMRGRHLWCKRTERDIRKAIEHFEKAIALDPNYALAYSGLADAWSVLPGFLEVPGAVTRTDATAKARKAVDRAIALDEGLAEAHASLGMVLGYELDLEGEERAYLRAIELNPGYFWAHFWYSQLLGTMARYQDQIREEDIAYELNPMSIPLIGSRAYRKRQTFEWREAEELYQRQIEIEPNRSWSYVNYAFLLAESMGRSEDAIRQCSLAVQIDKQAYSYFAFLYDRIGNHDSALWAANMYIESTPDKHDGYDTRGAVYAINGMLDSAIVSFEKALEIKSDYALSLRKLGNMHMFRREYAKAESLYQVLASHSDKEIRADGRLFLTQIPVHQGKLREGLRMLDELKDKALADSLGGNDQAYGTFKRGWIYQYYLDDQESAISEFEKVLGTLRDIDPNNWMVSHSRGLIACCHAARGDLNKADQLLRDLEADIEDYGPSALNDFWLCASEIEMRKGNFDTAVVHREKLVRLNPMFAFQWFLAQGYLGAGRADDAIAVYEKIINRYAVNRAYWPAAGVLTYYFLGQAYEEAGRYDDAIGQYETFLDIWKNADEGLASVDDARARLARLKGSS